MPVPECGEMTHQSRAWPIRERQRRSSANYRHRYGIGHRLLKMKQEYLTGTIKERERQQETGLQAFYQALTSEDKALLKQVKVDADPQPTLEERFQQEAEKWERDTRFISSTPKMVLHESYQKIIAMGPEVVPLLLRDLRQNRRSWFWALHHLTQANPVRTEDQGNIDKMIAAWLAWGKREGRI